MLNGVRMAPFRFCLPRDRIWCTRCSWCTNAQSQRGTSIARSTTDANIAKRPSRAGQSWMWIFVKIPPPSFSQATRTGSSHEQTTNRGSPRTEPLPRWMPRLGRRLSPSPPTAPPPPDCARGPPRRPPPTPPRRGGSRAPPRQAGPTVPPRRRPRVHARWPPTRWGSSQRWPPTRRGSSQRRPPMRLLPFSAQRRPLYVVMLDQHCVIGILCCDCCDCCDG
jgi:hypothetical protein